MKGRIVNVLWNEWIRDWCTPKNNAKWRCSYYMDECQLSGGRARGGHLGLGALSTSTR